MSHRHRHRGRAQLTVFDPSNYSQNILTAARTLTQINNQIQSLQNQARSLLNQAKNLTTIDFPELQALTQTLQQVDRLMGQPGRRRMDRAETARFQRGPRRPRIVGTQQSSID